MMDYYAIKADQCAYFVQLYDELEILRRVSLLPNFAYSYALAKFYNGDEKGADNAVSLFRCSDSLLFLIMYVLVCSIITKVYVNKICIYYINEYRFRSTF